jgi:hypothetical protein
MSGGGGSNSGQVDYPDYIKHVHADWLAHGDPDDPETFDAIEASVVDVMNAALGASPFAAMVAYDPTTALAAMDVAVGQFAASSFASLFNAYDSQIVPSTITSFNAVTEYNSALASIKAQVDAELYSTTEVDADIAAYGTFLTDQIDTEVLPRFRRGMQDINAVQSSAFVVGEAVIESARLREMVKYGTALRLQNYQQRNQIVETAARSIPPLALNAYTSDKDLAYRLATSDLEYRRALATLSVEAQRLRIIAFKEQFETNAEFDEQDAKWDLEVFQHGANIMAGIAGGVGQNMPKKSKVASALGGALAGAAMGAMAMPAAPYLGAAIGAVVGGIAGALSA